VRSTNLVQPRAGPCGNGKCSDRLRGNGWENVCDRGRVTTCMMGAFLPSQGSHHPKLLPSTSLRACQSFSPCIFFFFFLLFVSFFYAMGTQLPGREASQNRPVDISCNSRRSNYRAFLNPHRCLCAGPDVDALGPRCDSSECVGKAAGDRVELKGELLAMNTPVQSCRIWTRRRCERPSLETPGY